METILGNKSERKRVPLGTLGIIMILLIGFCTGCIFSCQPLAPTPDTPQDTAPTQNTTSNKDDVPPAIYNIAIAEYTGETAAITWETDKDTISQIEFGKTDAYGELTTATEYFTTGHRIELTGLKPNTTYHFKIKSTDKSGNQSESEDQSFTNWVADPDWIIYVNKEYGFSIQYPSKWKESPMRLTSPYHVIGFSLSEFVPVLFVVVFDADEPESTEWIVKSFKESGYYDINIVSPLKETTLGDGTKATTYRVKFSSVVAPYNLAAAYCLETDKNNKRIRIILATLEYYEPYNEALFSQIAHTLRFSAE
jgi:hypothetical protein